MMLTVLVCLAPSKTFHLFNECAGHRVSVHRNTAVFPIKHQSVSMKLHGGLLVGCD